MALLRLSVCLCFSFAVTAQAASIKQAFSEGKYQSQIRIYNNTLAFEKAPDKYGTAFGGRLAYETKAEHLHGFSLGMAYYTANDLGTNKEAAARAPYTPTVDVDIMGEAFVRWSDGGTTATAGRQIIDTPFANPSDAFVIPVLFTGYTLINKSLVQGLTVNLHHMDSVKTREATSFQDIGYFALNRVGSTVKSETAGMSIGGLAWEQNKLKVQGWYYMLHDIYDMQFAQADYDIEIGGDYTPFVSAQWGAEQDSGGKIAGDVESQVIGLKAGVKAFGANMSIAMNQVDKGRFLTPFTYFTDSLYTNSMITGFGNIAEGTGYKAMIMYDINPQWWARLSYSVFDFDADRDTSELGGDIRHKFAGDLENLSIWLRTSYRKGDTPPASLPNLIEYRTQIQYTF